MRIIQHPPHTAALNSLARALAAFVAQLDAEARDNGFDAKACARMLLLSNVKALGHIHSAEGDELLAELLAHSKRVAAERRKGGAA